MVELVRLIVQAAQVVFYNVDSKDILQNFSCSNSLAGTEIYHFPFFISVCTPSQCCPSLRRDKLWSDVLSNQQTHWKTLGWDQESWDNGEYNPSSHAGCFSDLKFDQLNAAKSLCYDQKKWDDYMLNQYSLVCGKHVYSYEFLATIRCLITISKRPS